MSCFAVLVYERWTHALTYLRVRVLSSSCGLCNLTSLSAKKLDGLKYMQTSAHTHGLQSRRKKRTQQNTATTLGTATGGTPHSSHILLDEEEGRPVMTPPAGGYLVTPTIADDNGCGVHV